MRTPTRFALRIFVLIYGLVCACSASAQEVDFVTEEGIPYQIQRFLPEDYHAHHQNWAVVQDTRGIIYVGNNNGILEHDGHFWHFISTPKGMPARSLAQGPDGRIYVGTVGDFGYLSSDALGRTLYSSLSPKIPVEANVFRDVWSTNVTSSGVFFQASEGLFRWSGEEIRFWKPKDEFYKAFHVRDTLYIHDPGTGLLYVSGNSLEVVPGSRRFINQKITVLLPFREGGLLVGVLSGQLYRLHRGKVDQFLTNGDSFFASTHLYHGVQIGDSLIALATLGKGVAVIDLRGQIRHILNTKNGLPDNVVGDVYTDRQGGLWIATDHGIARAEIPSGLMLFDNRSGLRGAVFTVARNAGKLYVGTKHNLYRKTSHCNASAGKPCFEPVFLDDDMIWDLLPVEEGLLVAGTGGISLVSAEHIQQIATGEPAILYRSRSYQDRVYVGMKHGLLVLQRHDGAWVQGPFHPAVNQDVRSIAEDSTGVLWVGTYDHHVIRIDVSRWPFLEAPVQLFSSDDGLPPGVVYVVLVGGRPAFVTTKGVYRFSTQARETDVHRFRRYFYRDRAIAAVLTDWSMDLLKAEEDEKGRVWLVFDEEVRVVQNLRDGNYRRISPPALRFGANQIFSVFSERGKVWFGSKDGLVRYDQRRVPKTSPLISTYIRQVTVDEDSLLHLDRKKGLTHQPLTHAHKRIQFAFAAPIFGDRGVTRYQSILEGFDGEWSQWTPDAHRTYTNLSEGNYTFRVRARGAYGYITNASAFTFVVLPPWYRTRWAYFLYIAALASLIGGYGRWRVRVKSEKLERQRMFTGQLKEANARLREANRLKDEFLTTISHEFRTPLASMAGFASILEEEVDEDKRQFARYIQESGSQLLEIVNSVLDMARLRAGHFQMWPERINVVVKTLEVVETFRPLASEKNLVLETELPESEIVAYLDSLSLERVVSNLISNAIKFTDEGSVTVRVGVVAERLQIEVKDTGIGISDQFRPKVFDEFRQESTGLTRSHQGVGLGLAITRHLVDLMGGEITVQSSKGSGSVFIVILPLSQAPEVNGPQEDQNTK